MQITTKWLLEYLEPKCTSQQIIDVLPQAGLEIEELHQLEDGDVLATLNVLPNRPDCLGIIGIAREVAAILGLKLRLPDVPALPVAPRSTVPVEVREPDLCPRYLCQLIRGVKVGPSPSWMQARLVAIGQRPINNVVDITNYILFEWGQPLHAFNFQKLNGGKIVVRRMQAGEKLELLSGKVIDASGTPLVIADAERPLALAGIMGGRESETNESTVDVLLEAACFDSVNIRKTVREVDIGLDTRGTSSSYRFERGTDPNSMLLGALRRASALIVELAGGSLEGEASDEYVRPRESASFQLTAKSVSACLGKDVKKTTIRSSLERLQMHCTTDLVVSVPTWRVDVNDPVVLIEDVARLIGYDSIPTRPSDGTPTSGLRSTRDRMRQEIAASLAAAGLFEARNPSLETPQASTVLADIAGSQVTLRNPSNREMSVARRSLLPGLFQSAERNLRRGTTSVRLFEIDRVFWVDATDAQPRDRWEVGGIIGGSVLDGDWRGGGAKLDFYHAKGIVEGLLDAMGQRERRFEPLTARPFVAGAAAAILDGNRVVGRIGELDAGVVDTGKVAIRLYAFELDIDALEPAFLSIPRSQPLARTPAVTRDLAIVVAEGQAYSPIEAAIRATVGGALESVSLVDVYRGPQVAGERKSLALRLVLRDATRTLTAEEAAEIMDRVLGKLRGDFSAELRS